MTINFIFLNTKRTTSIKLCFYHESKKLPHIRGAFLKWGASRLPKYSAKKTPHLKAQFWFSQYTFHIVCYHFVRGEESTNSFGVFDSFWERSKSFFSNCIIGLSLDFLYCAFLFWTPCIKGHFWNNIASIDSIKKYIKYNVKII